MRAVGADVVAVAPVREATAPVQGAGRTTDAGVVGTTADYASAARLRISSGRFLAGLDVEQRRRVAVLGASVASDLFPLTDPAASGSSWAATGTTWWGWRRGAARGGAAAGPSGAATSTARSSSPSVPGPRRATLAPTASTRSCCASTTPST